MLERLAERLARGEGSFREKNGRVELRICYKDMYGERKNKSFSGKTRGECLDRAEEFVYGLLRTDPEINYDITVAELARKKVDTDFHMNFTGEQGYVRNLNTVKIIEGSILGHVPVADVTERQVELFMSSVTHYSNTMIGKIYRLLRAVFSMAYDEGLIDRNFMLSRKHRRPKSDRKDKKVKGLTDEEQKKFLETLGGYRARRGRNTYKLQLLIELYGGLRMGEINALKPEDIDFVNGVINVKRTVSRGLEYRTFIKAGTKTYAGMREVPLNKRLKDVLEEAVSLMKKNPEGLIFYDYEKGGIVTTSQVNLFYMRVCKKAGIPYGGQHALRHTFATRCIEAGIPAIVLKKWLGHTNIHVTLDTYADVFDRMNFGSMEKFDDHMDEVFK